jgi:predicted phage terminase large subunit-like protein
VTLLERVGLEAIRAEQARRSLAAFIRQAWPLVEATPLVWNWHIDALCAHLEAVTRGEIRKLLINVPPGCMKSLVTGVFWPTWEWATQPTLRYLCASYSDSLTIRDNVRSRDIVTSRWYREHFPAVQLRADQNQKIRFDTTAGGWRIATSVGGRGTGEHPDRILIDDPHNAKQAESDAERQGALDWLDRTISSRGITRGARLVIIMQRLHEADMSGHILHRADAAEWTHLCLPMRYEPGRQAVTPLGWTDPRTVPGDLLWPGLFPEPAVHGLELALGSYGAAGQLQQRPVPAGGGMFQRTWFQAVEAIPASGLSFCRFWDVAGTDGAGDWTVGTLMARTSDGIYFVVDVTRAQKSAGVINALIYQTAQLDAQQYGSVRIREEQEPGSSGKAVIAARTKLLAGYDYKGIPSTGEKSMRWRPFAVQAEAGNVHIKAGPWVSPWLNELCVAPFGKHDDQADSAAGAFNELALKGGTVVAGIPGRQPGDRYGLPGRR